MCGRQAGSQPLGASRRHEHHRWSHAPNIAVGEVTQDRPCPESGGCPVCGDSSDARDRLISWIYGAQPGSPTSQSDGQPGYFHGSMQPLLLPVHFLDRFRCGEATVEPRRARMAPSAGGARGRPDPGEMGKHCACAATVTSTENADEHAASDARRRIRVPVAQSGDLAPGGRRQGRCAAMEATRRPRLRPDQPKQLVSPPAGGRQGRALARARQSPLRGTSLPRIASIRPLEDLLLAALLRWRTVKDQLLGPSLTRTSSPMNANHPPLISSILRAAQPLRRNALRHTGSPTPLRHLRFQLSMIGALVPRAADQAGGLCLAQQFARLCLPGTRLRDSRASQAVVDQTQHVSARPWPTLMAILIHDSSDDQLRSKPSQRHPFAAIAPAQSRARLDGPAEDLLDAHFSHASCMLPPAEAQQRKTKGHG